MNLSALKPAELPLAQTLCGAAEKVRECQNGIFKADIPLAPRASRDTRGAIHRFMPLLYWI